MTSQDLYIAQAVGTCVRDETTDPPSLKIDFDWQSTQHNSDKSHIFDKIGESNKGTYAFNKDNKCNIYQLGIQTLPGVKVKLGTNNSEIRIGQTGIFEINLSKLTPITTTVSFPNLAQSLSPKSEYTAEDGKKYPISNNYIIIDVVYSVNESGEQE